MSLDLFLDEKFQALSKKIDEVISKLNNEESKSTSQIYDSKTLASMLGISRRTLQNWRDKQLIEFSKVGSKIFYTEEQVQKFIKKFSITTTYKSLKIIQHLYGS